MIQERQVKKEIKKLEDEIAEKESSLNEIDILLADPQSYENHEKIVELSQKRDLIQSSLDNLYEEWILLTS